MPFITNYNFSRIIEDFKVDISGSGELYKKPIYFFNKTEKEKLLKIKEILQLNETESIKAFARIERGVDTRRFVFEGVSPAYHSTPGCETLNSEYLNFPIPEKIISDQRVDEFRNWFKEKKHFLDEGKEDVLRLHLFTKFGVEYQGKIQIPNSGKTVFEDLTLNELENRIDQTLLDAASFYKTSSSMQQKAISKYASRAFLHNPKYTINDNDTGIPLDELRAFLYTYDIKFKVPIKDLLKKYYMVKYNPKLEFAGSLLEQIGFKKCNKCFKDAYRTIDEIF